MKLALAKDNIKEILHTKKRYFSIMLIIFLGAGFFAGMKAINPDIKIIANDYYNENNFMDFQILSNIGITEDVAQKIENLESVNSVMLSNSVDVLTEVLDKEYVLKLHTLPSNKLKTSSYINEVNLREGSLPNNINECVADFRITKKMGLTIGDTIKLTFGENSMLQDNFQSTQFKIVGIVDSPYYISTHRGNSNLGNGAITSYIYCLDSVLDTNGIFTECYVSINKDIQTSTFSDEYEELSKKIKEEIIKTITPDLDMNYIYYLQSLGQTVIIPEYYVLGRAENLGYSNFITDIDRIDSVAKVFPIIFFLVAGLVSLTSMTRMVEENRSQIGTLRALGYSTRSILSKYLLYSVSSGVIGSTFGVLVGFKLFPEVIIKVYAMQYTLNTVVTPFHINYAIYAVLISILCITVASITACLKTLEEGAASLMRPKAPKTGKRVFLERIPFLWKLLNFSQKVTLRNLFRYKKRFFMTIFGIGGCTALLIAGFSFKHSVLTLVPDQYENVYSYDLQLSLKDKHFSNEEYNSLYSNLNSIDGINDYICIRQQYITAISPSAQEELILMIIEDNSSIENFISFRNRTNREKYSLTDSGIIITEKMANTLGVEVGDTITLKNSLNTSKAFEIQAITENYVYHYIYINKSLYENSFNEIISSNTLLVKIDNNSPTHQDRIAKELFKSKMINTGIFITNLKTDFNETMESLNYIVLLIIVSAGLLAFVVLYNLSNINIGERIRELATIKVLGFYNTEVSKYVYRENIILTLIGILFGFVGGYFIGNYIITSCEIDMIMFNKSIHIPSYLISAIITATFAIIVNIITHFTLKKIDMIEALKSVE